MIRTRFLPLALLGATLFSGCARRIPETEPADIPRLEAAVQANPYDPEALTYLGVAQYRARRLTEAGGGGDCHRAPGPVWLERPLCGRWGGYGLSPGSPSGWPCLVSEWEMLCFCTAAATCCLPRW